MRADEGKKVLVLTGGTTLIGFYSTADQRSWIT